MKTINRKKLIKKLESVIPGLARRKAEIQQSTCFVFRQGQVFTFNQEILCYADCDIGIEGAVPADILYALLSRMKEDELEIGTKKDTLRVEGRNRKAGIRFDTQITLPVNKVEEPGKWRSLPKGFADSVRLVKDCCSTSDLKFELTCVHITPNFIEASDNVQVARVEHEMKLKKDVLMLATAAAQLVEAGVDKFSETENWIHFKSPDGRVMCCRRYLTLEKYPNYTEVLGTDGTEKFKIPSGLAEAVEKASIFTAALDSETTGRELVNVDLDKGRLALKGTGTIGWYKEEQKIKYSGKSVQFAIHPATLRAIARSQQRAYLNDQKLIVEGKNWKMTFCLFEQQ